MNEDVRKSDYSSLRRAAAIVGNRGDIPDRCNCYSGGLNSTNSRLTAGTGTLDMDLGLMKSLIHSFADSGICCDLGSVRCRLLGSLEALTTGTGPRNDVAVSVGHSDDGIVECSLHLDNTGRYILFLFLGLA